MNPSKSAGSLPVLAAFAGNAIVCISKTLGFFVSGSSAMFSEAVHSFADTANQSLLLIGLKRSHIAPSLEYPYGHGRERYIWALISACGIFFIGAGVTVYHGIDAFWHPSTFRFSFWPILILIASFIIESFTLGLAFRELRKSHPGKRWRKILREADPTTLAVIYEDGLAVFGVLVALSAYLLSEFTGNNFWDAAGSVLIGALLGVAAIILIDKNRHYLVTTSIPAEVEQGVKKILMSDPAIEKVLDFKSAVLDVDKYLVKCDVEFNAAVLIQNLEKNRFLANEFKEIKDDYEEYMKFCVDYMDRVPRLVGRKIDDIEKKITVAYPKVVFIDIEIN
ncbi:MAG: cation diffusion facilitator family transporter [Bacillota bacterium]